MFEVRKTSIEGSLGWFATQDLEPGLTLLEEEALAIGPAASSACIECFRYHSTSFYY